MAVFLHLNLLLSGRDNWTVLEHEAFLKLLRAQANTWHNISDVQTSVRVYGTVMRLGQAASPNRASVAS